MRPLSSGCRAIVENILRLQVHPDRLAQYRILQQSLRFIAAAMEHKNRSGVHEHATNEGIPERGIIYAAVDFECEDIDFQIDHRNRLDAAVHWKELQEPAGAVPIERKLRIHRGRSLQVPLADGKPAGAADCRIERAQ